LAAPLTDEPLIWPTLVALAACLCEMLEEEARPTCFCGVVPGGPEVAYDYCGTEDCDDGSCGMAYVRLGNAYPTTDFPLPEEQWVQPYTATMAYPVEVGIMRCFATGGVNGAPPTADEYYEASRVQLLDMRTIKRAIECCASNVDVQYVLGDYTPEGPQGGCLGGSWAPIFGQRSA